MKLVVTNWQVLLVFVVLRRVLRSLCKDASLSESMESENSENKRKEDQTRGVALGNRHRGVFFCFFFPFRAARMPQESSYFGLISLQHIDKMAKAT